MIVTLIEACVANVEAPLVTFLEACTAVTLAEVTCTELLVPLSEACKVTLVEVTELLVIFSEAEATGLLVTLSETRATLAEV